MKNLFLQIALLCMIITIPYYSQIKNSKKDINPQEGIFATLVTNKGEIILNLDYEHVPMTVANFIGLAEGKIKNDAFSENIPFFNGSIWHRVVSGHVIQAGMPNIGKEMESPGYEFPNEIFTGLSHNKAGMLGMANAGPNTNGSEFYITLGDRSYLDGNYTLFGHVIRGMETVFNIVQGDTIKSIQIKRVGKKANNFIVTSDSFFQMVKEAKTKLIADEDKRVKEEVEIIQKNWPDAVTTATGLKYNVNSEGSGSIPEKGAVLKVQYEGSFLLSGYKFYSTANEGKPDNTNSPEEFDYITGSTNINPGINEMISVMKPGEIRTVIIPSNMAYGMSAYYSKEIKGKKRFVISPNTTLIYKITVFGIK